jgi:hypothetical protein
VSAGLRRRLEAAIKSVGRERSSRHSKTLNHKSVLAKPHMIRSWPPWPRIILSPIGANLN